MKQTLDEIKHNKLMNKKHKKTCRNLNYDDHLCFLTYFNLCCDNKNLLNDCRNQKFNINLNEFASLNNVLREYDEMNEMREEIKITGTYVKYANINGAEYSSSDFT